MAVRANRDVLGAADFDQARDRIILGRREGSNVLLPDEKYGVAVHESGHALVAVYSDNADPVAKVTILPAGQALGVTEQLPLVERHLYGQDYLDDMLAVFLGGRAGELVVLGQGSTGASNDLAKATELATKMVREFGLSDKLGPVGYPSGGSVFLGGGSEFSSRPFAEATQAIIDGEVSKLLREAEQRAIGVLRDHRDVLDELSPDARALGAVNTVVLRDGRRRGENTDWWGFAEAFRRNMAGAALDRVVQLLVANETVDGAQIYALAGRPVPAGAPGVTMAPGGRAAAAAGQGPVVGA